MNVCYNRLFKLLIDKGLKKTEFAKEVGIGQNTLAKLSKNEYVSMEAVSYTHLDVYKRQDSGGSGNRAESSNDPQAPGRAAALRHYDYPDS